MRFCDRKDFLSSLILSFLIDMILLNCCKKKLDKFQKVIQTLSRKNLRSLLLEMVIKSLLILN